MDNDEVGAPSAPATEEPAGDINLARRVFRLRTLLSFLVAFGIIALVASRFNVNVGELWRVMSSANVAILGLALASFYSAFVFRALRWRVMLGNAGVPRASLPGLTGLSEIIFLSWFVNCLVPAKLGDVYRAYLLRKHGTIALSKAGGTIVAERLIDFAIALSLLGFTGLWAFNGRLPAEVMPAIEIGSVLILIAGVGILVMRSAERHIQRFIPSRFQVIYTHFHEGALGSFGQYRRLLVLTLGSWLPEAARFFLVTVALGVVLADDLPSALAISVFIALSSAFLTALPLTPAGLGFAEGAITIILGWIGVDYQVALSVALLDRLISYWSLIGFGLLLYPFAQRK